MWSRVNPSPLLSGTMADCIASGRDVSEAGTKYNQSGIMCAGIGTLARLALCREAARVRGETLHVAGTGRCSAFRLGRT